MNAIKKLAIAGFILVFGFSGVALAEEGTIHLRLSPGATWVVSDNSNLVDDSFSFKGDLGYEFVNGVAMQMYYSYFRLLPESFLNAKGANVNSLGGGVRVFPLQWIDNDLPISPWVDVNLGWYRIAATNRFGFNVGAGIDFIVAEIFRIGPFLRGGFVL